MPTGAEPRQKLGTRHCSRSLALPPGVGDATLAMDTRSVAWTPDSGQDEGAAGGLSASVAAAALGVSQRTIRRAIARGDLPASKHAGVYRIASADLARYRAARQPTTPPAASCRRHFGTIRRSATQRSKAAMDSTSARPDRAVGQYGTPARRPVHIVGRTRERVFLREELAAVGGGGRLVLIGGEAGIGKTTLARDLTRAAEGLGARVLAGSCYDLTNPPPSGPWLDLFDACQRDPDLPTPPSAFAGGRLARIADQAALFAEVRRFFAALAADRPALVLLEDLHWADPASLDLLRHVGPHLRHWPVLLLATYRGDELTLRRPFAQQFPALVREADGHRLDLHRLDADALRALVASQYHLSQADEDRLVAYLTRHAEGNPFFATELLRTLEEEALLCPVGDRWRLAALDRTIVPSLLRQVIDGRVARLGEETRKPLAIAAVIGQEVPLALWAEVADVTEEGLFDIVEPAVEARLLEAAPDGTRVRFVHALTREALYEG
ncbi:MAG: hypothetical protein QOJ59_16, partial [Thermomicrobiales bacterium]|nr:hypothetical protein [Thermomicrobiales bacterium]